MSFLGGAECSTASNPVSQFTKHVQDDRSLQRDRLGDGYRNGPQEEFRSKPRSSGPDQMMNDFMNATSRPPPFAMEQLNRDLPLLSPQMQGTTSPSWAADFDPGRPNGSATELSSKSWIESKTHSFTAADFAQFQKQSRVESLKPSRNPLTRGYSEGSRYQRPMPMTYANGLGFGMGMTMTSQRNPTWSRQTTKGSDIKGKSRMVELDDTNWEEQFTQLEMSQQDQETLSDEADQAIESELNEIDRLVQSETDDIGDFESIWRSIQAERASRQMADDDSAFASGFSDEDLAAWDNFDSGMGINMPSAINRGPELGPYLFESQNPFLQNPEASKSAFEQGVEIMREHGNLSLAALAFEAALQQDAGHVEAWTLLGSAQAQNEKESAAIRALERALHLEPTNTDALMSLAVSYTNEGYDLTAYRTLERWLRAKYPQVQLTEASSNINADNLDFVDRYHLHERVTNLFIQAAQLSPSGEHMDPDVQVGLGVLFYSEEDFDKAVDCFNAALASSVTGTVNRQGQLHLLWNRLGATLANSGRSEDAISAYEKALQANPNFVRARYNLGVSCINIGCYPEAAQHLLGALAMHRVVEEQGMHQARELVKNSNSNSNSNSHGQHNNDGSNPEANRHHHHQSSASSESSSSPPISSNPDSETLERMIQQNESSNLYDTLRRAFTGMNRSDLTDRVGPGMKLEEFRAEFDF